MIFFYSYHLQANLPCFLWIFLIYCPLIFFHPPSPPCLLSGQWPLLWLVFVLPLGSAELLSQQTAWPVVLGGYNAERPPNDKLKWFLLWNDVQGAGRRSTGGAAPPQRCGWCQEMEPSSLGACHTDVALSPSSGSPCPAALCPHQYQLVHNSLRYL